jgi:hypothetical protein
MRGPPLFDIEEIAADAKRLDSDREARTAWVNSVEALLPAHTCPLSGLRFKWTTPLGVWKLGLDLHMFQEVKVQVSGPGGHWCLADHRIEYVAAFLRLVGAVE